MPIKWTAELDSILLHGVFEECNISFSKALCTKIAKRVNAAGLECSAKAVENRLYSWKKKNVSGTTNLNSATNTPSKTTAATTPKTPRSRAKATPRTGKQLSEDVESDGLQGLVDDEEVFSPSAARSKRTLNGARKATYAETSDKEEEEAELEDEYVPMAKRIKDEPIDEEAAFIDDLIEEEI